MADKYINSTGLATIKTWIKAQFASKTEFDALDTKVDGIVSTGGEPNTIDSITMNGTAVTPDTNKNVALTSPTKTSDLTNDGDGTSNFATEAYVTSNGGKIDSISVNGTAQTITDKNVNITVPVSTSSLTNNGADGTSPYATQAWVTDNAGTINAIKVNGTAQTITNKEVDITVPTVVSDLTNDAGYQTASDVSTAISTAVASVYKYKGSVITLDDLPSSDNTTGDVYDVQSNGMNYAWNGTTWDALGQYVDTSTLWSTSDLTAMTVAEINEILEA